jgi:CBS domain containing-hemolysin-like protein
VTRLEHMPELGDEVDVPSGTLRVERMDGPRIARIRFIPTAAASTATQASTGPEETTHV